MKISKLVRLRAMNLFICLSISLNVLTLRAAGGLVGNGGGLVEQNIFFSYQGLDRAIQSCLDLPTICVLTKQKTVILQKILQILQHQPSVEKKIFFVSEKLNPGFFTTGISESHRIAKTGLTPQDFIYFNLDMFYGNDGTPQLDMPTIAAVLIHELGHQTGSADHRLLDELGSQIRLLLMMGPPTLSYSDQENIKLDVQVQNYPSLFSFASFYLFDQSTLLDLTQVVSTKVHCEKPGQRLLGWRIKNTHWTSLAKIQNQNATIGFQAWAETACQNEVGEISSFTKAFSLQIYLIYKNSSWQFSRAQ